MAHHMRHDHYGAIETGSTSNDLPPRRDQKKLVAAVVAGLLVLLLLSSSTSVHSNGRTDQATDELATLAATTSQDESEIAHYYTDQLVDHFSSKTSTWTHRYYKSSKYFGGPGHPIFLVLGGEDPLERMLYPFVTDHLAKTFKAFVLEPEHRFYGTSQPFPHEKKVSSQDLLRTLTPHQAMADFVRLIQHFQTHELNCSTDRSSKKYCPVITVGGSYPGFLSAMMRLVHSDVVDASYAASAPLLLYSQSADQSGYYEIVTQSAERTSPKCPSALKSTLLDIENEIMEADDKKEVAKRIGVCPHSIPEYIVTNEIFHQEISMIVGYTFADFNMDNYPPTQDTTMAKACQLFQDNRLSSAKKLARFWRMVEENAENYDPNKRSGTCFDLHSQLPPGPNATISSADWSGAGIGLTAFSWEFQLCSDLIARIGFSQKSMFPTRKWSLEWLTEHCENRFGIVPQPYALVDEWRFDDLVASGASRILFTNGLNDMWSAGSIMTNLSDSIVALNFPNGAHHSDLSHQGPSKDDTDDIKRGFIQITQVLGEWLDEIRGEHRYNRRT